MGVKLGLQHLGKSTQCVNMVPKRDRYWDQKRSDVRPEIPVSYHP